MARVLVATNCSYWNRSTGAHQRMCSLVSYLVDAGHDVSVYFSGSASVPAGATIVPVFTTDDIVPRSACVRRTFYRMMGWTKGILEILTLSRRKVRKRDGYRTWHDFVSELERSAFLQLVNECRPHAVIVEYIWLTRLIVNLPARVQRATLLVLDSHDVMHERTQAFVSRNRPLQSGADTNEEADALRHFDIVLAIQQHEARKLSALCADVKVLTVLHGVETTPLDTPTTDAHRLLYVGSNAEPNIDGLQDFISSVWAELASKRDNIFLDVVGGICSSFDRIESPPAIELHGVVDDLESFYRRASIVVAPIPYGTGLKIKVVEALGYGKPVVTTPAGGEGLEEAAGSAFLVAASADEFVAICLRLIDSESERTKLGEAAATFATRHFSPKAVFGELEARIVRAGEDDAVETQLSTVTVGVAARV